MMIAGALFSMCLGQTCYQPASPLGAPVLPHDGPIADAGRDQIAELGGIVTLDALASFDPAGGLVHYVWTQLSGPPVVLNEAESPQPTFLTTEAGVYEFVLTIIDSSGRTREDVVRITVGEGGGDGTEPGVTVSAGLDQVAYEGDTVQLVGEARSNNGGELSCRWAQLEGPSVDLAGAVEGASTFVAPSVDADTILSFSLTASDGVTTAMDTVAVVVLNAAKAASADLAITIIATPAEADAQERITFEAKAIGGGVLPEGVYRWSFGDGQMAEGKTAAHAFSASGTYVVSLCVTMGVGLAANVSCTEKPVTIRAAVGPGGGGPSSPPSSFLPVAHSQSASTLQGAPKLLTLEGMPLPLTFVVMSLPESGTLTDIGNAHVISLADVQSSTGYVLVNGGNQLLYTPDPVGTFEFTFKVHDGVSESTPATVSIDVVATGELEVSPAGGLSGSGLVGGPFSPTSQAYTLSNTGSQTINWTAARTQSWVTLSAASGSLAAGGSTTVTVSINSGANGLAAGSYNDTVTFTNTTNGSGNTTRAVALTVNAPGTLSVSPAGGLSSSGLVGGLFSPTSQAYTLTNAGSQTINWTAAKTQSWVTLSAASGSLAAGGSTTVTVSINSGANSLATGSYNDTVTFTNTTNGSGNTTRAVALTVNAPGALSVSPAGGLSSSGLVGGPFSPTSQAYTLTNAGSQTINWTAARTQSWVTLSAASGSLTAGGSTTVTVSINAIANGLAAGSYNDTVTFTNTTNGSGNTTRAVALTVNDGSSSCLTSAPSWQNTSFAAQNGSFTVEFDAVPHEAGMDGLTGLSTGPAGAFADSAVTVRFNADGYIDAWHQEAENPWNPSTPGWYRADTLLSYTASHTYHFRLVVDIQAGEYDIYVTPSGSTEYVIGQNYPFRASAGASAELNHWHVWAGTGSHDVCNFDVTESVPPQNQAPSVNAGPDQAIMLPTTSVNLAGAVTDDGLPDSPGAVTLTWSQVSGPGTVTFSSTTSVNPTATFSEAGTYVLRLTAADGSLTSHDEMTVYVLPVITAQADPSSGTAPLVVQFTAMEGGSPASTVPADATFGWNLGDSTMATGAQVSHTYTGAGTFVAALTLTLAGGLGSFTCAPATTDVTPGGGATSGVLTVSPVGDLTSMGHEGGPFSPQSITYTLTNTGGESLNWTAVRTQPWVSLSKTGGTLAVDASDTVEVSINSTANGLAADSYSDTITFTTNANGGTTRAVDLTVLFPAMTSASRTSGVAPLGVFFDAVDEASPAWTSGVVQPRGFADHPANITGVRITRVEYGTPLGNGTLSYDEAADTLRWQAAGEAYGSAISVSGGGEVALPSSGGLNLHVWVNPNELPGGNVTNTVQIVNGGLNADWNSFHYEWDFGDPAPEGTSPTDPLWYWERGAKKSDGSWFEKNRAFGWNAAHVYEQPGTFTVTLRIIDDVDGEHFYSQQIQVQAEPPGGWTTYHFAAHGDDVTGDGSELNPFRTMAKAWTLIASNVRLRFNRGDMFVVSGVSPSPNNPAGPLQYDAYGEGHRPLFVPSAPTGMTSPIGKTVHPDVRVIDIEMHGDSPTQEADNQYLVEFRSPHCLALRTRVERTWNVFMVRYGVPHHDYVIIQEAEAQSMMKHAVWAETCKGPALLGCDFRGVNLEHLVRVFVNKLVMSHCTFNAPDGGTDNWKQATRLMNHPDRSEGRYLISSFNHYINSYIALQADNTDLVMPRHVAIVANRFTQTSMNTAFGNLCNVEGGHDVLIANNTAHIIAAENTRHVFLVQTSRGYNSKPNYHRNMTLVHNTFYSSTYGSEGADAVFLIQGDPDGDGATLEELSGLRMVNNVAVAPFVQKPRNDRSIIRAYDPEGPHVVDYNCWYYPTLLGHEDPRAFYLNNNYLAVALWRAAGHDINGLFEDPLLIDVAGGDFRPSGTSPCRGGGTSAVACYARVDADGRSRDKVAPTIGALEE